MQPSGPLARLRLVQGDLTKQQTDAIVNAASLQLRGGGGVDGAIHRAAGAGLLEELVRRFPRGCQPGEAVVTAGHGLSARWVIHTPGPIWSGGGAGERATLERCHREALARAREVGAQSVAFPAISCGVYGYPPEQAAEVALSTVLSELSAPRGIDEVRFVLLGEALLTVFTRALERLHPKERGRGA